MEVAAIAFSSQPPLPFWDDDRGDQDLRFDEDDFGDNGGDVGGGHGADGDDCHSFSRAWCDD